MTDYEKFKAEHPWLLWWEEFKMSISEWWYELLHSRRKP